MVTNIGFDDEHPFVEEGEDEGRLSLVGTRVSVNDSSSDAITVTIERSTDGDVWEPVLPSAPAGDLAMIDFESPSYGDLYYRATALTVEGAAASTTIVVEARSGALWLSGGASFGVTARLPFDPEVQIRAGRQRTMKQYAGRTRPVAYSGEALSRAVAVSGTISDRLDENADVERLTIVSQLEEPVFLFRDPDGRRIYGVIGEIQMPRQSSSVFGDGWEGIWGYSFTLTEAEAR